MSLMSSSLKDAAHTILLPDLASYCPTDLRTDKNHKRASIESTRWMLNADPDFDEATRGAFLGLKAGRFAAMTYPHVGYPQLRACSDFLAWFFHLDNLSDDMDDRGIDSIANIVMSSIRHPHTYHSPARLNRMTTDLFKRIMQTASPGAYRRLQETLEMFFQAVQQESADRASGTIPDLDSYIALRRDTCGCKTTWALIEYAYNLEIPNEVMDHPIIRSLGEATSDFVAWSNDIWSYDGEQAKGQTHNMVDVIMHEQGICTQDAVDVVGDYCVQAIERFVRDRANLPSWGPVIDADVEAYVEGLANWIVGVLNWSFETERYFGKAGRQIKATRRIMLRPKLAAQLPVRPT